LATGTTGRTNAPPQLRYSREERSGVQRCARRGPVDLTIAVELRLRGVPCRVIERLLQAAPYAKAVGIQPRTLKMWERQGHRLLRDVLARALPMTEARSGRSPKMSSLAPARSSSP
jgi:FAD binding domain